MKRLTVSAAAVVFFLTVTNVCAQPSSLMIRQFERRCATCHRNAGVDRAIGTAQAPQVATLTTTVSRTDTDREAIAGLVGSFRRESGSGLPSLLLSC
jgi:hypothetical protein